MSTMNMNRHGWPWWSCFAVVKHNKKSKKQRNYSKNTQKSITNVDINNKQLSPVNENTIENEMLFLNATNTNEMNNNSCIIKIELPVDELENHSNDIDYLEQISIDEMNSSSLLHCTQLDAIVEDNNEENVHQIDEFIQSVRLYSDRDIINDSNNLHSRLLDLSRMNHVIIQFRENGNFLCEFIRQIEKLKIKTDDITQFNCQLPCDAQLLEARYSTLLASIESLSLLLQIAQIPACRLLISQLISSIEQRSEQLKKLAELTSISNGNCQFQRQDINDDDLPSFHSALSSYEHLFTRTS